MNSDLVEAYVAALKSMEITGPRPFHKMASASFDENLPLDDAPLCQYLEAAGVNDSLRMALRLALARWDHTEVDLPWTGGTAQDTAERRQAIVERLAIGVKAAELFRMMFPVVFSGAVVIASEWKKWYTEQHRTDRFYWNAYSSHLLKRGWAPEAVANLDQATDLVVERLSDPSRSEPYQVKGLVVGHVQSGKTANFTGVIAKAIDAGYRLIIVLTGTTDRLRTQTQRRIDMELVGQENILRGIDPDDEAALAAVDYQGDDPDWPTFLRHEVRPSDAGRPDLHRMTTRNFDYRSLEQGINALDFLKRERSLPLFHPENLATSDARLVVVKKNATVLRRLVKDLGRITMRLSDIPTLIIDDESDQASLNTMSRKKWVEGHTKRTEINRLLSELLTKMPRAQYVGYTATPFANVFVDPTDAENIFPKDFLIALDRPVGYMGAQDFHDLDSVIPSEDRTFANSHEKADVRPISDTEDSGLEAALDSYVLAGAVKLYRRSKGVGTFRHHTMLIHEAMHKVVHRDRAERLITLWNRAGYHSTTCMQRLRSAYETDILPVARATAPSMPTPETFDEVRPFLAPAVEKIGATGNPVLVINSDQIEGEALDFERNDVWRILIGGNQLARGFTVEGLTTSYYRRRTNQADTLMQMGRWFGFRQGYRDLTRLYITSELYAAFEAACRDEEYFRAELKQYAVIVDGRPLVTPADVRPLVASHLPWLKPAAPSKMYNAELAERRTANKEPNSYPSIEDTKALEMNAEAFEPLLRALTGNPQVEMVSSSKRYKAWSCEYPHADLLEILGALAWSNPDSFRADLAWLRTLPTNQLSEWFVVAPQLKGIDVASICGRGPFSLHRRGQIGSPPRIDVKTGVSDRAAVENAVRYRGSTLGGMMLYPMVPKDMQLPMPGQPIAAGSVVIAFRLILPESTVPQDGRLVTFRAGERIGTT